MTGKTKGSRVFILSGEGLGDYLVRLGDLVVSEQQWLPSDATLGGLVVNEQQWLPSDATLKCMNFLPAYWSLALTFESAQWEGQGTGVFIIEKDENGQLLTHVECKP
jgi:hypothetical protein